MDTNKEQQDIMSANELLTELRKLADSERSENEPTSEEDASHLDDAIASLEKFVEAEKGEEGSPTEKPMDSDLEASNGIVDTGILTGPINGLKNFLIRKSQDRQPY